MRKIAWLMILMAAVVLCLTAQTESKAQPPMQVPSDLNQLMRGVIYPAANVVFYSQNEDPATLKSPPGKDPSLATDPLLSTFGGWRAVENAALALSDSANLLSIPGRKCSNGLPVPMDNPDWAKFVQELRDAGMKAYKAAQTKNQDTMIEVSDVVNNACSHCHRKWREKPLADRCK